MINWDDIRAKFPACEQYTYLNPAGGSPISIDTANAAKEFYDEILHHGDVLWENWLIKKEDARKQVATLIHAEPSEIAFISNTSQGMNYIADLLYKEGSILTMEDEFPSTTIPWLHRDAKLVFVPSIDNCIPIDHIEKYITPETRVLVTSYVQYKTGFRQDLLALKKLCKKYNLLFIVNATQAIGVIPIDVKKMGIDMLVFTGLKWALAGYGASGIFISTHMQQTFGYPFAGWLSVTDPGKMDNKNFLLQLNASVIESGCSAFPNIFALGKSMELLNQLGSQAICERILFLTDFLREQTKHLAIQVAPPHLKEMRSGISIFPTENATEIMTSLQKQNIIVSARGAGIRVSVHIYNNEADIVRFAKAFGEFV